MKIMEMRVAGAFTLLVGFILFGLGFCGLLGSIVDIFFSTSLLDGALRVLIAIVLLWGGLWLMGRARLQ